MQMQQLGCSEQHVKAEGEKQPGGVCKRDPHTEASGTKSRSHLWTLWLARRGLGHNHSKAIKGQEGPDFPQLTEQ